MLAERGISTQETTTKHSFATKGEADGKAVRESGARPHHRSRFGGTDRTIPGLRLPSPHRRPGQRRAAVAARILRDHLDRASVLFQFCYITCDTTYNC